MYDIQVKLLPHACSDAMPRIETQGAAGYDLRCSSHMNNMILYPGERKLVGSGIAVSLPVGFVADIRPRSGLAFKHGISVLNAPGTIDSDYRGEIKVLLINHSDKEYIVARGDRIAQMVILKLPTYRLRMVTTLPKSGRGVSGFGSTGTH